MTSPIEPRDIAEALIAEAQSRLNVIGGQKVTLLAIELALSGWTPPPPVSPRVRAMREWLSKNASTFAYRDAILSGNYDNAADAEDFFAGYAAAVKEAEPLVEYLRDAAVSFNGGNADKRLTSYLAAIGDE